MITKNIIDLLDNEHTACGADMLMYEEMKDHEHAERVIFERPSNESFVHERVFMEIHLQSKMNAQLSDDDYRRVGKFLTRRRW